LAAAATFGLSLAGLVVVSVVPLALAGMLVAGAYAARGREIAGATYAIDLFAAASGCLIAPHLLGPLAPTEIVLALGLVCCALAAIHTERRSRARAGVALIAVAHASLLVAGRAGLLPDGPLEVLLRFDSRSEQA